MINPLKWTNPWEHSNPWEPIHCNLARPSHKRVAGLLKVQESCRAFCASTHVNTSTVSMTRWNQFLGRVGVLTADQVENGILENFWFLSWELSAWSCGALIVIVQFSWSWIKQILRVAGLTLVPLDWSSVGPSEWVGVVNYFTAATEIWWTVLSLKSFYSVSLIDKYHINFVNNRSNLEQLDQLKQ